MKKTLLIDKYVETVTRITPAKQIKDYFVSLSDKEAIALLVKFRKYNSKPAAELLAKVRQVAKNECDDWPKEWPVAMLVRQGFTLKEHAPQFGPCFDKWRHLQSAVLINDRPTKDSIIFGVPRLLFIGKSLEEELCLLGELRNKYELSPHFFTLCEAVEQAGLILSHYHNSGERTPLYYTRARTNVCYSDGGRLCLGGFGGVGLVCDWGWDEDRYSDFGVFALGVEALGR